MSTTGWQSLLTILETLKDAPAKRRKAYEEGEDALAKRVKGVDLGQ